jgi:Family of unknown function (DUF6624)
MSLTPSAAAALRAELLARVAADQKVRKERPVNPTREYIAAMMAIDRANSARMRQIITVHGWPGQSVVGEDGSRAAWLLVQHGPDDLQEQALVLLGDAVRRGDASPGNLAYLTDRVRMHRGEPQLYGTQYRYSPDAGLVMHEVEDPDRLDERRAAAGLGPHAEYDASMRGLYAAKDGDERPAGRLRRRPGQVPVQRAAGAAGAAP